MKRPDPSAFLPSAATKVFLVVLLFLVLTACRQESRRFADIRIRFEALSGRASTEPATPVLPIVSRTGNGQRLSQLKALLEELETIRAERLPEPERADYHQFRNELLRLRDQLITQQYDPALYNLGGELMPLLADTLRPVAERNRLLSRYLAQAPAYYDSAKAILRTPDPGRLQLAVRKQRKSLLLLDQELTGFLSPPARDSLEPLIRQARFAVKDYLAFCESLLFERRDSTLRR